MNNDIDFLVKFSGVEPIEYFDNYMNFKTELEVFFAQKVCLVELQTVNCFIKKTIDWDKLILYGPEESKLA